MIKKSGYADLPLHTGTVPKWLADRMMLLGTEIIEALVIYFGRKEVLVRLSDPLWFQSLGCVLGMDWHSSGITTSVMYALKRGLNPRAKELGIAVCGGRGRYSKKTPEELKFLSEISSLDADSLIHCSRLAAKVDGCAVQDGFNLYQHNFIVSCDGDWTVVQQGMNTAERKARRYHWSSSSLRSFVDEPHSGVTGENQGLILNLSAQEAENTRQKILTVSKEKPEIILGEIKKMGSGDCLQLDLFNDSQKKSLEYSSFSEKVSVVESRNISMPQRHELRPEDIDLKRLGAVLALSSEAGNKNFEKLLLTPGLGPRTLQSLTLVSEVIYGTPSRFTDPARFSFAHGGKDGHPFPVPVKIYDETIRILGKSIEKAKLNVKDKDSCLYRLEKTARYVEENCNPQADFYKAIEREKENSRLWGGRTVGKNC